MPLRGRNLAQTHNSTWFSCMILAVASLLRFVIYIMRILLPPPVDTDVGGACEPGVQEVNAAHCPRPSDGLPQRRVVVQTEALPEPVDGIWGHFILRSGGGEVSGLQQSGDELLILSCWENGAASNANGVGCDGNRTVSTEQQTRALQPTERLFII